MAIAEHPIAPHPEPQQTEPQQTEPQQTEPQQTDFQRAICRSRGTCLALLSATVLGAIAVIALVWALLYNLAG